MVARKRARADQDVPRIVVTEAEWAAAIAGVEAGIAAGLQPLDDGTRPARVDLTGDQRTALDAVNDKEVAVTIDLDATRQLDSRSWRARGGKLCQTQSSATIESHPRARRDRRPEHA